jgi:pimeloyl-ACP methyl ester carboxylesterase
MAHTLIYESMILQAMPAGLLEAVRAPTLVLDGEKSPAVMRHAAQALAEALLTGRYHTLEGQSHDLAPAAVAPVLEGFFRA